MLGPFLFGLIIGIPLAIPVVIICGIGGYIHGRIRRARRLRQQQPIDNQEPS